MAVDLPAPLSVDRCSGGIMLSRISAVDRICSTTCASSRPRGGDPPRHRTPLRPRAAASRVRRRAPAPASLAARAARRPRPPPPRDHLHDRVVQPARERREQPHPGELSPEPSSLTRLSESRLVGIKPLSTLARGAVGESIGALRKAAARALGRPNGAEKKLTALTGCGIRAWGHRSGSPTRPAPAARNQDVTGWIISTFRKSAQKFGR